MPSLSNLINYLSFMIISGFVVFLCGLFFIKLKFDPENYFFIKPLVKGLIRIFVLFAFLGFILYLVAHS